MEGDPEDPALLVALVLLVTKHVSLSMSFNLPRLQFLHSKREGL